jgi:hypothetical protein
MMNFLTLGKGKMVLFAILICTFLLLLSCGEKAIGYGVFYWPPEDSDFEYGDILPVLKYSSIAESYSLQREGESEGWGVEEWRIGFFEEEEKAIEEQKRFRQWQYSFAISQRDRLAIRSEADPDSERVYVLRFGQTMKVIGRDASPTTLGEYEGHWYRVLTEDGVSGYCFDHYLEIFDIREGPIQQVSPELTFIKEAFSKKYHPEYFKDMIRKNQIVLEQFTPRYGFFPDLQNKQIEMLLPNLSRTFNYETIEVTSNGNYVFTGSGLSVNFLGDEVFAAIYPVDGKTRSHRFIFLPEKAIEDRIASEKERRQELISTFTEDEGVFSSSAYGLITFTDSGTFTWSGKERLIPDILPAHAGDSGRFSFDYFLGPELTDSYDGVLHIRFSSGVDRLFLYQFQDGVLRLWAGEMRNVKNNIVPQEPFSSLLMVFVKE